MSSSSPPSWFRRLAFHVKWVVTLVFKWTFWAGQQVFGPRVPPLPPVEDLALVQSAATLAQWIREGKRTAESVVTAHVGRVRAVNATINAVVDERFALAVVEAREVDRRLATLTKEEREALLDSEPLLGVPFTCKENIMVTGMNHTGGLVTRRGIKAKVDAAVINNLRQAGAIPIGVTNVSEMGLWSETVSTMYGRTNNPYDVTRTPGGSSGGEGALLASCGTPLSVGSDVGGSIRIPSFCCGVFGHKPTSGWVSLENGGIFPEKMRNSRVLVLGPMSRSARDLTLALQVMAPEAATGLRARVDHTDLRKLKVWWTEGQETPMNSPLDPSQQQALTAAIAYLHAACGVTLEKVRWPRDMGSSIYLWFNKMKDEYRGQPLIVVDMTNRKGEVKLLWEWLRWVCGQGSYTFATMVLATREKLLANKGNKDPRDSPFYWRTMKDFLVDMLGEDGVLVMPTLPCSYYHHEMLANVFDMSHTTLFSATEMPATAVPLGLSRARLPLGVQVVAAPGKDHLSLAVAEALEDKFGGWLCPTPITCQRG